MALFKILEEPNAIEDYPFLPLIIFFPIILFWFTEAIYGGQTILYRKQIIDFENKINIESSQKQTETKDNFLRSHYEYNFRTELKILSLLDSIFKGGTLTSFYLIMLLFSFAFIIFFFPNFFSIWKLLGIAITIIFLGYIITNKFIKNKIKLKET